VSAEALHPVARLPEDWTPVLAARGERAFRAKEVFRWIHARGALGTNAMSSLPASLRAAIDAELGAEGTGIGVVEKAHRSSDATRKLIVRLRDGASIETVLIPRVSGPGSIGREESAAAAGGAEMTSEEEDEEEPAEAARAARIRVTQCVSTQVGCAMGCVFCASGVAGWKRNLGPEEIIGQILLAKANLDEGEELRNVVYMGMGEPLHNYASTARSLRLLSHPDGIGLSKRRITVSTSGLIPEIKKLGEDFDGQIGLAISLHAADDESRTALMPINKKYPLRDLMDALRAYPLPKRRRITIEYTLVSGKNDSILEAKKLVKLLAGLPVKVNLIPMNPIEASTLGPPDASRVFAFQAVLADRGMSCFVRRQRGDDVAAACGQLALAGAKPKVKGFTRRAER
jgi:23S rRNA (adenine2503-C2)-methyltransferase